MNHLTEQTTIDWLLDGDPAIVYLTHRDLLGSQKSLGELQARIAAAGYGAELLGARGVNGHWGIHYYQPKWTSTHYTLLDLKELGISPAVSACREMVARMFENCQLADGGMNLSKSPLPSDAAVDGMVLSYSAWFCPELPGLKRLAEALVSSQKPDGGFSWDRSSPAGEPHATICVVEGLVQYLKARRHEPDQLVEEAVKKAEEFLLANGLFMDSDPRFRRIAWPWRYRYDLLRVLVHFSASPQLMDNRLLPALDWLLSKQQPDGRWPLELIHPGQVHALLEAKGRSSRIATLKALTILQRFENQGD